MSAAGFEEFKAGWHSIVGCSLCMFFGPAVVGFYSFSLFLGILGEEFGWSHTQLGLVITLGTVVTALSAPIAARLIDRLGPQKVLAGSTIVLAADLLWLSFSYESLLAVYLGYAVVGALCSTYYISIPRIISLVFDNRRGLALGLTLSGTGLGNFIVAPLLGGVLAGGAIDSAYRALAASVLFISFPAALFLVRPTSLVTSVTQTGPSGAESKPSSAPILILMASFGLVGYALHGFIVHFIQILGERGLAAPAAASLFGIMGLAIFAGRIGCGILMDRLPAQLVGAIIFGLSAAGIVMLGTASNYGVLVIASLCFGLGVGAELDLLSYIVSRVYPLRDFSRLYGRGYAALMIGTSIGPPAFGIIFDQTGSYSIAVYSGAVTAAAAAGLLLFIRYSRPAPKEARVAA